MSVALTYLYPLGLPIKPIQTWTRFVANSELESLRPKNWILVDAQGFSRVWNAYWPDHEVPKIDFERHFLVVETETGTLVTLTKSFGIDQTGTLPIAGESGTFGNGMRGFRYFIHVFPRKGIKAYYDKPVQ